MDMNVSRASNMISVKNVARTDMESGQGIEIMWWDSAILEE